MFELMRLAGEVPQRQKDQRNDLDLLLLKLCHGAVPLGIIGLRNFLCERNSLVYEDMRRNGVKLFLMCLEQN